jgi:hypothetical protein
MNSPKPRVTTVSRQGYQLLTHTEKCPLLCHTYRRFKEMGNSINSKKKYFFIAFFSQSLKRFLLCTVSFFCLFNFQQLTDCAFSQYRRMCLPAVPPAVSTPNYGRKQRNFRARCSHLLSPQNHNDRCYTDALNTSQLSYFATERT